MGFLDKKKRIIDTYLTPIGRKKIAEGMINFSYIAISDSDATYPASIDDDVSVDFKSLIMEAGSSYKDGIFIESNTYGKTFSKTEEEKYYTLLDYTLDSNGNLKLQETVPGQSENVIDFQKFVSQINGVTTGSFDRIKDKQYIKTKQDEAFEDFKINKNLINFYITRNKPIKNNEYKEIDIDTAEPFFFDKFVSNTDSYKFLPPVFLDREGDSDPTQLGNYEDLNQKDVESFKDISDLISDSDFHEVIFDKNSRDSNIIMQMFKIKRLQNSPSIQKLDTIDFGEYYDENKFKKVIFAGKVFNDTYSYPTYINIFTIILEE